MLTEETTATHAAAADLWYGIRTKSKCEKVAATSLTHKGYVSFLPCYRRRHRWTDRVTEIESPLFPGYVFCRFNVLKRLPILTTPGVVSVVGIGKQPLAIPDHEITAIETILRSELFAEPWPYLREGERVRIDRGPLNGLEGIVVKKTRDEWRIVVSVTLLQRSVAAEIDRDWIRAIK